MSPKIHETFWSDSYLEDKPAEVKLTLLWLISNGATNCLGICEPANRRFELETNLPSEVLGMAIKALPKSLVQIGSKVFVKNFIRHQFGTGPKLIRNHIWVTIRKQYEAIKDDAVRSAIRAEYPEFEDIEQALGKGLGRAYIGLTKPKGEGEGEGEGEKGKGVQGGRESPPPPSPPSPPLPTPDEIFAIYPRHEGKADALKAIREALKIINATELRRKVSEYSKAVADGWTQDEKQFIPWCQKWMNRKRWLDDPATWRNGKSKVALVGNTPL